MLCTEHTLGSSGNRSTPSHHPASTLLMFLEDQLQDHYDKKNKQRECLHYNVLAGLCYQSKTKRTASTALLFSASVVGGNEPSASFQSKGFLSKSPHGAKKKKALKLYTSLTAVQDTKQCSGDVHMWVYCLQRGMKLFPAARCFGGISVNSSRNN